MSLGCPPPKVLRHTVCIRKVLAGARATFPRNVLSHVVRSNNASSFVQFRTSFQSLRYPQFVFKVVSFKFVLITGSVLTSIFRLTSEFVSLGSLYGSRVS